MNCKFDIIIILLINYIIDIKLREGARGASDVQS